MSRNSRMSERLRTEIASKLGVQDIVSRQGWGGVSSRDCGNIVKMAFEIAEDSVSAKNP